MLGLTNPSGDVQVMRVYVNKGTSKKTGAAYEMPRVVVGGVGQYFELNVDDVVFEQAKPFEGKVAHVVVEIRRRGYSNDLVLVSIGPAKNGKA
ncbi:MAG: hypothetical protein BIFFINMI_00386 [Phycisphaerae bacterium]|nr:hypothetical protein [Phycisphaerae bacterium]